MTETDHCHTRGGPPAVLLQRADVNTSFPVLLRAAGYRAVSYGQQHVRSAEGNDAALKRMFVDAPRNRRGCRSTSMIPDQLANLAEVPEHTALLKRMCNRTDELTATCCRAEIERLRKKSE